MRGPLLAQRSTRPVCCLGLALALLVSMVSAAPAWEAPTLAPAPETTQQAQFDNEFRYVPIRQLVAVETAPGRSPQTLARASAPSPALAPCLACWIIPPMGLLRAAD